MREVAKVKHERRSYHHRAADDIISSAAFLWFGVDFTGGIRYNVRVALFGGAESDFAALKGRIIRYLRGIYD